MSNITRGLFFVIDGSDASGKKTQTELLAEHLKKIGKSVLTISFPRYGTPSAKKIEAYLAGELGDDPNSIDPYAVSELYAYDRLAHAPEILNALNNGTIVISDRYVTANMGHQGGKFDNEKDRDDYLRWLYQFEYEKNKIPIPDLNIILHVPTVVSQKLSDQRGEKKDIHEKNPEHLRRAEETYLQLPRLFKGFVLVECYKNESLLSQEEVHKLVWEQISPFLNPA